MMFIIRVPTENVQRNDNVMMISNEVVKIRAHFYISNRPSLNVSYINKHQLRI